MTRPPPDSTLIPVYGSTRFSSNEGVDSRDCPWSGVLAESGGGRVIGLE